MVARCASAGTVFKTRRSAIGKTVLATVKPAIVATVIALKAALGGAGATLKRRRSGATRIETVIGTGVKTTFRATFWAALEAACRAVVETTFRTTTFKAALVGTAEGTETTAFIAATKAATPIATRAATALGTGRCRRTLFGLHARDDLGRETLMAVSLDVANAAAIAEFGKGHRHAIAASAAGAANAVCVVLGLHGQAEVKHVGDGGHVDAARSHIGGNQNLHTSVAQRHQAAVAQALAQGTVQGHGIKTGLLQVVG